MMSVVVGLLEHWLISCWSNIRGLEGLDIALADLFDLVGLNIEVFCQSLSRSSFRIKMPSSISSTMTFAG